MHIFFHKFNYSRCFTRVKIKKLPVLVTPKEFFSVAILLTLQYFIVSFPISSSTFHRGQVTSLELDGWGGGLGCKIKGLTLCQTARLETNFPLAEMNTVPKLLTFQLNEGTAYFETKLHPEAHIIHLHILENMFDPAVPTIQKPDLGMGRERYRNLKSIVGNSLDPYKIV